MTDFNKPKTSLYDLNKRTNEAYPRNPTGFKDEEDKKKDDDSDYEWDFDDEKE